MLCFTQAWAGTFGTQLLALLGADVVQIETVKRPDVWRGAGAPVPPGIRNPDIEQNPLNTNGMYNTVNLNKRAITLDMGHPRGREMFWAMLPQFDVVADNFSPHVMENWGVNLETLNAVRPGMIMASVSGYGRTGPFAEYAANGATTEPMAGLSSIHGYEGDAGQRPPGERARLFGHVERREATVLADAKRRNTVRDLIGREEVTAERIDREADREVGLRRVRERRAGQWNELARGLDAQPADGVAPLI